MAPAALEAAPPTAFAAPPTSKLPTASPTAPAAFDAAPPTTPAASPTSPSDRSDSAPPTLIRTSPVSLTTSPARSPTTSAKSEGSIVGTASSSSCGSSAAAAFTKPVAPMPRFDSSRLGAAKIAMAAATPAADATTNAGAADDFVAFTLTPPAGAFLAWTPCCGGGAVLTRMTEPGIDVGGTSTDSTLPSGALT